MKQYFPSTPKKIYFPTTIGGVKKKHLESCERKSNRFCYRRVFLVGALEVLDNRIFIDKNVTNAFLIGIRTRFLSVSRIFS